VVGDVMHHFELSVDLQVRGDAGRAEIVDYHFRRRNVMALTAIHPGEHLAEELKELGMSAAELARKLSVPTNRVTGILNGQRAITGDTALRPGHFFGTSAEFC
jgi:addiction module HigA family antidote